jgi:hypothetical protein
LLSAIPIDGLAPDQVRLLLKLVREQLEEFFQSDQLIHPTMAAHVAMTIRETWDAQ